MKSEKSADIPQFPELTEELKKQVRQSLPTFIIKSKAGAYCSYCEEMIDPNYVLSPHRKKDYCPICHRPVTVIDARYAFKGVKLEARSFAAVFLNDEATDNLYARCYTLECCFKHGEQKPIILITEEQRYVFTEKRATRYGTTSYYDEKKGKWAFKWQPRVRFSEPAFCNYSAHTYTAINVEAIRGTCMKYSALESYDGESKMDYLKFYMHFKGVERLTKCGLSSIVERYVEPDWSLCSYYSRSPRTNKEIRGEINWKETEVHKMLGVTRDVCRNIIDKKIMLFEYRDIVKIFPDKPIEVLVLYNTIIQRQYGTLEAIKTHTGFSADEILKYLIKQKAQIKDYHDYVRMARTIGEDVSQRIVAFPRNLTAAHDRVAAAERAIEMEKEAERARKLEAERDKRLSKLKKQFDKLLEERTELEFTSGAYMVRQPKNASEIVAEGKALEHCVAGYAERHCKGETTIMFLRKVDAPETPFYTMEIDSNLEIEQCRGFKNNWVKSGGTPKPKEIELFEQEYQRHLNKVLVKRKSRAKKSAGNAKRKKTA